MSLALQTRFTPARILFKRAARRLLWPLPHLYCPVGLARKRGNVFSTGVDLYISGYPRSGNTFSRTAFLSANPGICIQSHRHIPTFVLEKVQRGIPGIVLIREPLDAAISWSIHQNMPLEESVAYWNDYYEALLPVRSQVFVATFDDVTADFGAVMRAFNEAWGTSYVPFEHTPEATRDCFQATEEEHREPGGNIREMQVCRPSASRRRIKEKYLRELPQSKFLRDELAFAEDIYRAFVHFRPRYQASAGFVPERAEPAPMQMGAMA
jgi:hypothetical protein